MQATHFPLILTPLLFLAAMMGLAEGDKGADPAPGILFDTDMGNDVDDALALGLLLEAEKRGAARALLVVSSNPNPWAVPGIRAILRYYGREEVPVGACMAETGLAHGGFTEAMAGTSGLQPGGAPGAVALMRKVLHEQGDRSVRIVPTGFSTNLAALLASAPNHGGDGIPLSGRALVEKKVEFLSIMAGNYHDPNHAEFNVAQNVPAFKQVIEEWPTPVYMSGFEIGLQVHSRWEALKQALKPENPIRVGYEFYFRKELKEEKWDRPSWDQTAMLQAIYPESSHFDLSDPVRIEVSPEGKTTLKSDPPKDLPARRFLRFSAERTAEKVGVVLDDYYREP
ncbi:MAG: nucleoside hydrolase [Candidatus Omnitrophica bacterium]|nr:hypothetical protein [bacterium]NUN95676.1 nucleoside hydrolase [Candidatus Omnitrophota bacterium]